MAFFDPKAMLKAAGVDVGDLETRFKMLQETVQAGYVAFVEVQAVVLELRASNARLEAALLVLLTDRNEARELAALKSKFAAEVFAAELEEKAQCAANWDCADNGVVLDVKRSEARGTEL